MNKELVELLEGMLASAKDGDISEIYITYVGADGEYRSAYDVVDLQLMITEVKHLARQDRIADLRGEEKQPTRN